MRPLERRATYPDLLGLPEGVHAEIVDGRILTHPSPRPRHSKAQGALSHLVGGPFDHDDGFGGPGGLWIFLEVDVRLGEDVVRPDLAGRRRERLADPDVRPVPIVPDWVCKVVSESNEAYDRVTKRCLYAEHGVRHYWIVDPDARTLETLSLSEGRSVDAGSFGDADFARVPPFEQLELPVARLFLPK